MALQVVHSSTDGFSAGVAARSRVQFDVSGKYEEEGDDCRKGVPPKRKNGIGSSSPGPVRRAEPVGCVPERLHLYPREEGCRGRHGEAAQSFSVQSWTMSGYSGRKPRIGLSTQVHGGPCKPDASG